MITVKNDLTPLDHTIISSIRDIHSDSIEFKNIAFDSAKRIKDMHGNVFLKQRQPGKWLHVRCNMYECSECSRTYSALTPDDSCDAVFCPYCGIKLEGTE